MGQTSGQALTGRIRILHQVGFGLTAYGLELNLRFSAWGLGLGVWGLGCSAQRLGFKVLGLGFKASGLGLGFKAENLWLGV